MDAVTLSGLRLLKAIGIGTDAKAGTTDEVWGLNELQVDLKMFEILRPWWQKHALIFFLQYINCFILMFNDFHDFTP